MRIEARLNKVEKSINTVEEARYKTPAIVSYDKESGEYQFIDWERKLNKGTKEEIKKLLEPYQVIVRGYACVIWDDIE